MQAAQYEELLGGALQIFYRTTMQGRNQQRLNEIRWVLRIYLLHYTLDCERAHTPLALFAFRIPLNWAPAWQPPAHQQGEAAAGVRPGGGSAGGPAPAGRKPAPVDGGAVPAAPGGT